MQLPLSRMLLRFNNSLIYLHCNVSIKLQRAPAAEVRRLFLSQFIAVRLFFLQWAKQVDVRVAGWGEEAWTRGTRFNADKLQK